MNSSDLNLTDGLRINTGLLTPGLTPGSSSRSLRSGPSTSSPNTARSPYLMPPKSATMPSRPPTPPSPELSIAQDSAFPLFPTSRYRSRSKSSASKSPAESRKNSLQDEYSIPLPSPRTSSRSPHEQLTPFFPYPTSTPDPTTLVKTDTVGSASSDTRNRKGDASPGLSDKMGLGIFKRKSLRREKKDISSPEIPQNFFNNPQATPPMPALPAGFVSNTVIDTTARLDGDGQRLPSGPAPPRPARPEPVDGLLETLQATGHTTLPTIRDNNFQSVLSRSDSDRSKQRVTSMSSVYSDITPSERRMTNAPSLEKIVEDENSVAGSPEASEPPPWPSGRLRSSSRPEPQSKHTTQNVPPIPQSSMSRENMIARLRHTPTASASSNDSRSAYGDSSESGASTPPTSNGSSITRSNLLDENLSQINFATDSLQERVGAYSSLDRSQMRQPSVDYATKNSTLSPTMNRDLAAHSVALVSPMSENGSPNSPEISFDLDTIPPVPTTRPKSRYPASKHDCRGCGHVIKGKSVKAADGRLTGRYHKECEFLARNPS